MKSGAEAVDMNIASNQAIRPEPASATDTQAHNGQSEEAMPV